MFRSQKSIIRVALAIGLIVIGAPVEAQALGPRAGAAPTFRPESFFLGHTEGTGLLKIVLGRRHSVRVHGYGRIAPDGTLILNQNIEQAGKPLKHRRWVMRSVGGGRYTATLSDATGPVVGEVQGNVMNLDFPANGGLRIRQTLVLAADGQSAANRLAIYKFGIVVGQLNEVIKRVG